MRTRLVATSLALLAGLAAALPAVTAAAQSAGAWEIGPTVRGRNMSVGMPAAPTPQRSGWSFDFPNPHPRAGHVHYVTAPTGPLDGKSRIVVRFRIDAAPGVRLAPRESPQSPATLTLYFQRRGDNWSARGRYEHYRLYAAHAHRVELSPGEHEISLPLDGRSWKSVQSATGADAPAQFADALANAERVGFVFGGGLSAGHGVYATGPARFHLLSFRIV